MSIDVKVSRIHRIEDGKTKLKAFADIEINESLLVKGLQIVDGKKGLFVSMPRERGKDNVWYETIRILTPEVKRHISSIVLSAYKSEEACGDGSIES